MALIYKICTAAEWREAEQTGAYRGSAVDRRDGFIHFSTAEQAAETAAKWFAGQRDLVLVAVDADALGDKLKWEPSRGGALFRIFTESFRSQRCAGSTLCRDPLGGCVDSLPLSCQASRPNTPRPVAKSGRAAGKGTGFKLAPWTICKSPAEVNARKAI